MRKIPPPERDFYLMYSVVGEDIKALYKPNEIRRAKKAKKELEYGFDRHSHFVLYGERRDLSDSDVDNWLEKACAGRGRRFVYKTGRGQYKGVFLGFGSDAVKFRNKLADISVGNNH